MLERLRFWVANLVLPEFEVIIKLKGGHQHVQKLSRVSRVVSIKVQSFRDGGPRPSAPDEATVALTQEEREARKEVLGYMGTNYAGMDGDDAACRDAVFKRANALRGARPIDPDVVARLRGNLQDEGKLPK